MHFTLEHYASNFHEQNCFLFLYIQLLKNIFSEAGFQFSDIHIQLFYFICKKLPPYTLAGFDLTFHRLQAETINTTSPRNIHEQWIFLTSLYPGGIQTRIICS
jgi:hypothetical protein